MSANEAAQPASSARPMSPVGPVIVALWLTLGAALAVQSNPPHILMFAFVMLGWLLSVMAHEYGHALVAHLGGDHTVKTRGYLDFDPRHYADPVMSLVLPLIAVALGGIGFPGGAVYLRTDLIRSPQWRALASLAGPGVTALIMLVLTVILHVWSAVGGIASELYPAMSVLAFLQAMALILNLLPIPGLDGFGAISPFLPDSIRPALRKAERVCTLALLVVLFVVPGGGGLLFRAAAWLVLTLGLQGDAIQYGWDAFHFWK